MPPPFVLRDLQRARGLPRDVLRGQLPQLAEQLTPVAEQADAATSASLSAAASSLGAIDNPTLDRLVAAHTINDTQAQTVGFSAALYTLVDQDEKLATSIRGTNFAPLANRPPGSTADLAALSVGDWTGFFTANPTLVPSGATPGAAGAAMAARLSALHPGLALAARLPRVGVPRLGAQ